MQLHFMCNLSYGTTQICSCMCCMQLNFSCKRQLQNPEFLVVVVKWFGAFDLGLWFMRSRNPRAWSLGVLFFVKGEGWVWRSKKALGLGAPIFLFNFVACVRGAWPVFCLEKHKNLKAWSPKFFVFLVNQPMVFNPRFLIHKINKA